MDLNISRDIHKVEMDQSEAVELTPNVNNWQKMYPHTGQDDIIKTTMDRSTHNIFKTPHDCRSGDSGFISITPDSAESGQDFNLPSENFGAFGTITPNVNFHPYNLPVNSTPASTMDMIETSLYAEDEQMKDHFILSETDQFNINDVDENNVMIFKDEKSTNIFSLYNNLNTLSTDNEHCISDSGFATDSGTSDSNVAILQGKTSCVEPTQVLLNTTYLVEHPSIFSSPKNKMSVHDEFLESNEPSQVKKKRNFNQTNLKNVLQRIDYLPSLISPIEKNLTPSTGSIRKKRSLNGIERLDILYLLGVKENFLNIIMKIFSYLTPYDLMNVKNVSMEWNQIFSKMSPYQKKWREFKKQYKEQKENVSNSLASSCDLNQTRRRGRQTYLSTIENTSSLLEPSKSSPQLSPPVSPSKRRFHLFHKEGQKLKQGERLLRCPKCTFPSRDPGTTYATCTRVGCKYEFCIFCCGEYKSGHHCPSLYTPRPCKRTITIGSKGSKRNLRRL